MSDIRLIERWLPIAILGEESVRERRSMTALPPIYYLHVWWARRPPVASRAAVLASLLPEDADREKFLYVLGIHGNPVEAKQRIDTAKKDKRKLNNPYGYKRAFTYTPNKNDKQWVETTIGSPLNTFSILDPTAGGGSIPFEAERIGCRSIANDLNPVAALILKATIEWPILYGTQLVEEFRTISRRFVAIAKSKYRSVFPYESEDTHIISGYLWARTITCPYCTGLVPLSPNWRLAPDGTGVHLKPKISSGPNSKGRVCSFEIVANLRDQSPGTVSRGDATCPYSDCGRVISGDEIKQQAQYGRMGEQLYAVVYKKLALSKTLKSGKQGKEKWVRCYRAPRPKDDNSTHVSAMLTEKIPEWEALDIVPSERFPEISNDNRPIQYGMPLWRDLFSPRQLFCHGINVEVFREMLQNDQKRNELTDIQRAAYGYLSFSLDKLLSYNSRMSLWHGNREVISSVFDRHDFSFKWSYAEMAPMVVGLGLDWAIEQTSKCINELVSLVRPKITGKDDLFATENIPSPPVTISCKPGDSLDHIENDSVDVVVMDPPYYDNVMYAELSDFFYVWLKRTAGYVYPEFFRRNLTDKDSEAVANPARFQDQKGSKAQAGRDYQERMMSIFEECRRVLKSDGILTLMFTHKATGAWDALTKGLIEAGFTITASWPINTEAPSSLHIREKAAAKSTIFLVCRPCTDNLNRQDIYWEDVEPKVAKAVRQRIGEFQDGGITGVDLYLASFGPALEEFSRHWSLKRGTPREKPAATRGQLKFPDDKWDPYAATPENALNAACREVKRWRLNQLTHLKANADLDPPSAFFILAWDTFRAPMFSYDEALILAHFAVGIDLERDIVGRFAGKKGSNIVLWDSTQRAAKGTLGPTDGSQGMIDAIHHSANLARTMSLNAAREMLAYTLLDQDTRFFATLEAVLEVLPVSAKFTGLDLEGQVAASGSDFEVLYELSRLAYSDKIGEPKQLNFWRNNKF